MLEVQEYLVKYGVRPSPQRVAVMHYLMNNCNHPTADMIYAELSPKMPTLSRMTVYNTLNMLADKGAVLALNIDDRQTRFDGDTRLHAHFMCDGCGGVEDVLLSDDSFVLKCAPFGAEIRDVQLLYKGLCKRCRN